MKEFRTTIRFNSAKEQALIAKAAKLQRRTINSFATITLIESAKQVISQHTQQPEASHD